MFLILRITYMGGMPGLEEPARLNFSVWPQEGHFNSLYLSFLICKKEVWSLHLLPTE